MAEVNAQVKFCADCGEQINSKAEICPKCGVRQIQKKTKGPSWVIIMVVVLLVGVVFIGILAAISIPQFSAYRMKGYNSAAISDIRNAKTCLESYYADKQKYPTSLAETSCGNVSKNVDIGYDKRGESYVLVTQHMQGSKQYMMTGDNINVFARESKDSNAEFLPLN